ncbi:hypothetical protein ACFQ1S_28550 [Kibdelosporangium lantanae]|uniref:CBU-0592-like domain-containing protein n=1 Tax=Kibdelosporangium lantanae TaxID=1497396 RepID=A0ABW3MHR1_9PSEU
MTDLDDPVTTPAEPETAPAADQDRIRFGSADVVVLGCFLFAAILLYSRLWTDLDHAYLLNSMQDENMFEWFFAVAAQHPGGLLFNDVQNYPVGINMMANTSVLGLGVGGRMSGEDTTVTAMSLQTAGAVLILACYAVDLYSRDQQQQSKLLLLNNFLGSTVIAITSIEPRQWGSVLLEGAWARRLSGVEKSRVKIRFSRMRISRAA